MENNELYHHGVKEMKWGRRRYQNEDGSLTEEGRIHYGYGLRRVKEGIKSRHEARAEMRRKNKLAKQRAKSLEAARKARQEKAEYNKAKKKALETGTADEVAKYINDLSAKEKQDALLRLRADADLNRLASDAARVKAEEAAKNSKWNKFNGVSKKAGEFASNVENWSRLYNASAKVINAVADTDLKLIGEKKNSNEPTTSNYLANEIMKQYNDMPISTFMKVDSKTVSEQASKLSMLESIEKKAKKYK